MSSRSEHVDLQLLRRWGLPEPGDSKKSRGQVVVVGGSRRSPGAVMLAGEAALRVGAGRLGLVAPASIASQLGFTVPEAAAFALPESAGHALSDRVSDELESADAVLIGPGFDDAGQTRRTLVTVAQAAAGVLVLDAFAIGVLSTVAREDLPSDLILNVNLEEAAILLDRELSSDRLGDVIEIARRFDAVVHCYGTVATGDGAAWQVGEGSAGLGTSGSGDVLAGAITGFAARGVEPARAAVWGSWAHSRAGDRLTERVGLGFLAREVVPEMTAAIHETQVQAPLRL